MSAIRLRRTGPVLSPDPKRVLLRSLYPGNSHRVSRIIARILTIPEEAVEPLLKEICAGFRQRHQHLHQRFHDRFEQLRGWVPAGAKLTEQRRQLIGAYFLCEYSLESAALFNPSIVPHPDQAGVPSGAVRFILSLRATGEGHISSITFREGIVHADHRIEMSPPEGFLVEPRQIPNPRYEKPLFLRKLEEMGLCGEWSHRVMRGLGDSFTVQELREALASQRQIEDDAKTARGMWALARSNYEVQFLPEQRLPERVLFPATPSQRNGIEDARFVRFENEDGSHIYYATFTAYDGRAVMPELVETVDFLRFRFLTLNGPAAQNKGMALFPRRINGSYAMLSRQDAESIYLMYSDNVHFWNERELLLKPEFPWEMVQIGNCGSPIETDAGWLVLSHGVGPLRQYCIGAFLLDRNDPGRVIGRLAEPLLHPEESEREGYVPNVVYTCGALLHGEQLIVPYGLADHATGFAAAPVKDVLAAMESVPREQ